jgi:hypothetical protein
MFFSILVSLLTFDSEMQNLDDTSYNVQIDEFINIQSKLQGPDYNKVEIWKSLKDEVGELMLNGAEYLSEIVMECVEDMWRMLDNVSV